MYTDLHAYGDGTQKPASNALTDNEKDISNMFWLSITSSESHFVFDLGCAARINAVYIRNSHNKDKNNRQVNKENKFQLPD